MGCRLAGLPGCMLAIPMATSREGTDEGARIFYTAKGGRYRALVRNQRLCRFVTTVSSADPTRPATCQRATACFTSPSPRAPDAAQRGETPRGACYLSGLARKFPRSLAVVKSWRCWLETIRPCRDPPRREHGRRACDEMTQTPRGMGTRRRDFALVAGLRMVISRRARGAQGASRPFPSWAIASSSSPTKLPRPWKSDHS